MIGFLLDEGVITVGSLSGLFTTSLLNSLKKNIIDPGFEKILPTHKLDTSSFADMFPIPTGVAPPNEQPQSNVVKWQTFLKDFITWIFLMLCLYLFWKKVIYPNKLSKISPFQR